tara:strand:- start:2633 stop:4336 length:1704 start_codon:yes stop_codon:yes gene_type:complete
MVEIFFYSYLISLHIYICGYLFFYIIIDKKIKESNNIFEFFFFGLFAIGFVSLFLNFIVSLNKLTNIIIFFAPFFLFLLIFNKNFLKKSLVLSFPVSLLLLLTISYDGTYRPDAGSYHLPYISILNEHKILIGINNIHFRFGHTSIIQYVSSIYNNYIFNEQGITIPIGLVFCNFIGYCVYELFNQKNNHTQKILIFILLSFVFFRVNRYSDFGNDAPANLLFFYLIIESIKGSDLIIKIKKTILTSTFIFLNKVTLLLGFLIPVFYIFKYFKIKLLINKVSIFSLIFLFLYFGKNILVSGCLMFPVEQTCIEKIFWYDKDSNRGSNAINARLENEAWTKGWMDQKGEKKTHKEYLESYNWIEIWLSSEGKKIINKLAPFFIFTIILLVSLLIYETKNKNINNKKHNLSFDYYLCLIISILGSILWFLKFPVFRYGYSYLITFFAILIVMYLKNFNFFLNGKKTNKYFKITMIIMLAGISLKNINRIYQGIDDNINAWPNIYNSDLVFKKNKNIGIKKNDKIIFYKANKGECYFSKSPCTHFYNGQDFSLNEINVKNIKGYKIYFFN